MKKSQTRKIYELLKNGGKITPIRAFSEFSITRLSGIIYVLRRKGAEIETDLVDNKNGGAPYAAYWVSEEKMNKLFEIDGRIK